MKQACYMKKTLLFCIFYWVYYQVGIKERMLLADITFNTKVLNFFLNALT